MQAIARRELTEQLQLDEHRTQYDAYIVRREADNAKRMHKVKKEAKRYGSLIARRMITREARRARYRS